MDDKQRKEQNRVLKLEARKAVKEVSNDSDWDLVQELLQEIMATHTIKNPEVTPKTPQLIKELKAEIEKRYKQDSKMKEILINGIPSIASVREWIKHPEWKKAVWDIIHGTGLFTHENRVKLINALHQRGVEKDTAAAKIWLQLSGDLDDADSSSSDSAVELFREINKAIYSKND